MRLQRLTHLFAMLVICLGVVNAAGQTGEADPAAARAFEEMIKSHRARAALTVKTKVNVELRADGASGRSSTEEAEFVLGPDRTGIVKFRGFTCYLSGGTFTAIHEGTEHSYFSTDDQGAPYYALLLAFVDLPFPHLAMTFGEDAMSDLYMQLDPKAPDVVPTSVSDEQIEGRSLRRLVLSAEHQKIDMLIDPQTQLIESFTTTITGGPLVQSGATLVYQHEFEYETHERPLDPKLLAFESGDRQRVDHLATLLPRREAPQQQDPMAAPQAGAELAGKPAPALILETLDGDIIDLSDLAGEVVVLDFWASWCGPCRKGLPLLHQVADWAEAAELPVRILTVNTREQNRQGDGSPDVRRALAGEYWKQEKFTLPVLMDYSDAAARDYGVTGIPTTVIIRPDGLVHEVHVGIDADGDAYIEKMKSAIQRAIEVPEAS